MMKLFYYYHLDDSSFVSAFYSNDKDLFSAFFFLIYKYSYVIFRTFRILQHMQANCLNLNRRIGSRNEDWIIPGQQEQEALTINRISRTEC